MELPTCMENYKLYWGSADKYSFILQCIPKTDTEIFIDAKLASTLKNGYVCFSVLVAVLILSCLFKCCCKDYKYMRPSIKHDSSVEV